MNFGVRAGNSQCLRSVTPLGEMSKVRAATCLEGRKVSAPHSGDAPVFCAGGSRQLWLINSHFWPKANHPDSSDLWGLGKWEFDKGCIIILALRHWPHLCNTTVPNYSTAGGGEPSVCRSSTCGPVKLSMAPRLQFDLQSWKAALLSEFLYCSRFTC